MAKPQKSSLYDYDCLYRLNPPVYIDTGGGQGCTESVYRGRNLHIRTPSLPSMQRRVPSRHGRKSYVLYLHGPLVRPTSHSPDARGPLNPGLPQLSCAFYLDAQALNANEHHVISPLMIATFIMQSITFITLPSQVCTMLIFPYNKISNIFASNFYCLIPPMTTYLKDLTQSIGRYGGLSK